MAEPYRMNKSWGNAESQHGPERSDKGAKLHNEEEARTENEGPRVPHIHFHPHHNAAGEHTHTTVHVMHHDGGHEKFTHHADDTEGAVQHVYDAFGQQAGGPLEADNTPAAENEPEETL